MSSPPASILLPERLRIVVDELADEHVTLLRLVDGGTGERHDEDEER